MQFFKISNAIHSFCVQSALQCFMQVLNMALLILSCRHTFSPVICSRQLPFCREDFPLNDVTFYLDLKFDSAIDFPIYI